MDRVTLLTVNYAAAVGVAGVLLGLGGRVASAGLTWSPTLLGLSVGTGVLLIAGFFVLMLATDIAGMSLAIGVMRVSVVIPFLASWLVWNEVPTVPQGAGLVVAGAAFFLIAWQSPAQKAVLAEASSGAPPKASSGTAPASSEASRAASSPARVLKTTPTARVFGVLALTFVMGGAVDVAMKAFEESFGASNSRVLFLLLAFGVAFLIGATIVITRGVRTGQWPEPRTAAWGVGLGVINYGSLEFILRAIEVLPGTFVFPANNIAIVILAAALGVAVWNETLSRPNRVGLGLAVLALLLLSL
jgi:drug/metabolite transporter (DMT)-like permease